LEFSAVIKIWVAESKIKLAYQIQFEKNTLVGVSNVITVEKNRFPNVVKIRILSLKCFPSKSGIGMYRLQFDMWK